MFEIFKTKTAQKEVKIITSQDIQNEMNDKLQFLLGSNNIELVSKEVEDFESQNKEILEKATLAKKLGFKNVPVAKLAKEINTQTATKKKSIELQQEEIELTKQYSLEYPMYKFVPERIFEEVRNNYNLFTSETSRYIKEIPQKNLEEIVNFIPLVKPVWELTSKGAFGNTKFIEKYTSYKEAKEAKARMSNSYQSFIYFEVQEKAMFEITAPIDHFDLKDSTITNRQITTKVEDPIVTYQVKGGRIIVSVWDREAEIPEIRNNILN